MSLEKNKNWKFYVSGVCAILFLLLIVLLRTVDVAAIGPQGTEIGFSHLNRAVFDFFGVHTVFSTITDGLGILVLASAALFAVMGLVQWIKRKSILKIDRELWALGGLYLTVIILYVLFEFAVVNYRPILLEAGQNPEPSFPSSHTMIACVILGSAMMVIARYVKNRKLVLVLEILSAVFLGAIIILRLASGVHWFTDIVGGILISAALLALFSGLLDRFPRES